MPLARFARQCVFRTALYQGLKNQNFVGPQRPAKQVAGKLAIGREGVPQGLKSLRENWALQFEFSRRL
jgi:hypothetical protein